MGLFSSSKSWGAQAARGGPRDRKSREIIARHAKQAKKEKKAKQRRKAHNKKFGRGPGIVCGWADLD